QSQYRATLGPRSRHQPEVRGLDSRIWMVARETNSNHGRLRHTDRSRQAIDVERDAFWLNRFRRRLTSPLPCGRAKAAFGRPFLSRTPKLRFGYVASLDAIRV